MVVLQNIVDGRIEVKSSKNPEVVVTSSFAPGKVEVDIEQVGDRIDINASALTTSTQPHDTEANFTLTVPEETELQLKTQTGLILVEQVNGDMKLESIAGDVHLKEVSGYIIVKTTGGSLVCTNARANWNFPQLVGTHRFCSQRSRTSRWLRPPVTCYTTVTSSHTGIYNHEQRQGPRGSTLLR